MRHLFFVLFLASSPVWPATDLLTSWNAARNFDPAYQGDMANARAGNQKHAVLFAHSLRLFIVQFGPSPDERHGRSPRNARI